jgi:uncharacterized protein YutE (UPF0331/DUF86 family)
VDVDRDRLQAKLDYIRARVAQLRDTRRGGKDAFRGDPVLIDATVRRLQTAIEAAVDAALHIVVRENLGKPADHADAFRLLAQAGVIPAEDLPRLLAMVRFRNLAVHLYADVDDLAVWDIVDGDLADLERLVARLARRYLNPDD